MSTLLPFAKVLATHVVATAAPAAVEATQEMGLKTLREQEFMDAVVARLRTGIVAGQTPEQVVTALAMEQAAFASVLVDPAITQVAGEALYAAKQATVSDPRFTTSAEEAHNTMGQIFLRRAAEVNANIAKLTDAAFLAPLVEAARNPQSKPFTTLTLQQVKAAETLEELVHRGADGTVQVLAHIKQFQEGTILTHDALAKVFAPQGALHQALLKAMADKLPNAAPGALETMVGEWLAAREAAAQVTVQQASNAGHAYHLAKALSVAQHPVAPVAPVPALPVVASSNESGFAAKVQAAKAEIKDQPAVMNI